MLIFQGHKVEIIDDDDAGNYPLVRVRYPDSPDTPTEWVAADAVTDTEAFKTRLEYLRGELRAERISWGELAELQGLEEHIQPGDAELLEAAGVPEHAQTPDHLPASETEAWLDEPDYDNGEE